MYRFAVSGLSCALALLLVSASPLSAAAFISTGDGAWEWQNPLPQANDLYDVFFIDADTGWVVGPKGVILKTTNGGTGWSPQVSGTKLTLRAVQFVDPQNGWAAGGDMPGRGVLLRTTDGGASWTSQDLGGRSCVNSIHFLNASLGYAATGSSGILKTTDGGRTWTAPPGGTSLACCYASIRMADADVGWAGSVGGYFYKTTDGWETAAEYGVYRISATSVYCVDVDTAWAVGQADYMRTTDGGATWQTLPQGAVRPVGSVFFLNRNLGWSADACRTTDGGATWERTLSPGTASVWFADADTGWLVGSQGAMLKTTSGGTSWTRIDTGARSTVGALQSHGTDFACAVGDQYVSLLLTKRSSDPAWISGPSLDAKFTSVSVPDAAAAYIGGLNGKLYRTVNAGTTWSPVGLGTTYHVKCICFFDQNTGWVLNNIYLRRTADGGTSWAASVRPAWCLSRPSANKGWAAEHVMFQRPDGTVGNAALIYVTNDGGASWLEQEYLIDHWLHSIDFTDSTTGWAGGSILLRTADGGETWTPVDAGMAADVICVDFADSNTGWVLTMDNDTLLRTIDGGATWSQIPDPGGPGMLKCLRVADADSVWVAGEVGQILFTPTSGLPGCAWAKQKQDGTAANFGHLVVTARFADCIYAEHPERQAGIRINTSDATINVGDFIYVHGSVGTTALERAIDATSIDVVTTGWGDLPPRAIRANDLGGAASGPGANRQAGITGASGPNNIGLLVRTWGRFTYMDASTFTLDDGSGTTVRCVVPPGVTLDPAWSYVAATGISSCEQSGGEVRRLLRVRDAQDVRVCQ